MVTIENLPDVENKEEPKDGEVEVKGGLVEDKEEKEIEEDIKEETVGAPEKVLEQIQEQDVVDGTDNTVEEVMPVAITAPETKDSQVCFIYIL